jgi:hypothetical protein
MKTKHILILGFIVAFSSCSTAYKTGQTPDDVYYSPAPVQTEEAYVVTENRDSYNNRNDDSYYNRDEDQQIRRGIQDPRYRSGVTLDLGFGYNPYSYNPYGYSYYPYSPYSYNPYSYNPYAFNNYGYKGVYDPYYYNGFGNYNYGYNYFNPYYGSYYPPVYVYPGIGKVNNSTPRKVNLGAYSNPNNSNTNRGAIINRATPRTGVAPAPVRSVSPPSEQKQTGVGNVIRRVFTPSVNTNSSSNNRRYNNNNSNNRSYNNNDSRQNSNPAPQRTFDNSSSTRPSAPSNNNNSSSGGSAPVRTFRK